MPGDQRAVSSPSGDERGASTLLGVVLLLALVMAGMAVVVTVGATALTETKDGLDTSRAQKAMTQFDSRSAMVALGGTSHQGVDLATGGSGQYGVDAEAGWMNVSVYNQSADEHKKVVNATLGAVVYENGQETIAYQGGGVWQETEGGVRMLSPPEFHFRQATLTLPIITVDGSASLGAGARISQTGSSTIEYPDPATDANFTNPLDSGRVNVTVHSRYYEAWGAYFEDRTDGGVYYDHANDIVTAELVIPFNEDIDNVLASSTPGGISRSNGGDLPSPRQTGVNYESPDSRIEDRIDECQSTTTCESMPGGGEITSPGTYFVDGDYSGEIDVDDPGGNVTVVVNGDMDKPGTIDVDMTSPEMTTLMVRGDFDINSDVNAGGVPGQLAVVLHSTGEFESRGNTHMYGMLYAPGSTCHMRGIGYFEGGAVCDTVTIKGDPGDFQWHPSVENAGIDLHGDVTPITYLHVTRNSISVTGG
jgi:hypothetical protein